MRKWRIALALILAIFINPMTLMGFTAQSTPPAQIILVHGHGGHGGHGHGHGHGGHGHHGHGHGHHHHHGDWDDGYGWWNGWGPYGW